MSLIDIHIQSEEFPPQIDFYDEMNVQLANDDYIQSRCGEIFISQRRVLIFVCTECKENFCSYDDFFMHLCEQHTPNEVSVKYEPTEEEDEGELTADGNFIVLMDQDDEESNAKPSIEQTTAATETSSNDQDIESETIEVEAATEETFSQEILETFETIDEYEALDESETYQPVDYLKSFPNENNSTTDNIFIQLLSPKPKRTTAFKVHRSPSPVPEVFIDPLPQSTPQFVCTHCHEKFKLEFDLKNHLKIHEAKRKYKCEICGFRFTLISNLRAHVRRHIGEKTHACDECEKCFWTSTELKTHRRKHTGERPFICEFCGNSFKTSGALTDHEKRHTQKKRHKCSECDRSFLHLQVLREHMNTHTLDRPFVCKVCNATFARKHSLTQHSSLHSAEKKYVCEICSKHFAQLPGLLAHKRRHKLD